MMVLSPAGPALAPHLELRPVAHDSSVFRRNGRDPPLAFFFPLRMMFATDAIIVSTS